MREIGRARNTNLLLIERHIRREASRRFSRPTSRKRRRHAGRSTTVKIERHAKRSARARRSYKDGRVDRRHPRSMKWPETGAHDRRICRGLRRRLRYRRRTRLFREGNGFFLRNSGRWQYRVSNGDLNGVSRVTHRHHDPRNREFRI